MNKLLLKLHEYATDMEIENARLWGDYCPHYGCHI